MKNLFALLSGIVFGVGLGIAGMTNPAKVIGFLDITGSWDASLAFVMVGAIAVNLVALRLFIRNRSQSILGALIQLPTAKDIDWKLVSGAALFGIGWGLGGYCPGPGLTSLATGARGPLVFVGAMALGIFIHALVFERKERAVSRAPEGATS